MAKKQDYLQHLSRVPMFSACSKRELQLVARNAEELTFPEGAVVMKEGAPGREFFVIVDGKARVTRRGRQVATLGAGGFFGELALLDRAPRNASVTATSDLHVFVLGQREFAGLLNSVPSLSHKLMVGMARRLHELDART